jgi:hypothetical protein
VDGGPEARSAALSAAATALDAELERSAAPADLTRMLRACARGGHAALEGYVAAVDAPATAIGEAPAIALVAALADAGGDAADRALRAAAWTMAAQRLASAWPSDVHAVFKAARAAMPLDGPSFEHMVTLGMLTACANTTDDPELRDGQRMQFSRESLEHVIGAATYRRPARRDLLHAIAPWTTHFKRGIAVCDGHLRAHDAAG